MLPNDASGGLGGSNHVDFTRTNLIFSYNLSAQVVMEQLGGNAIILELPES